MEGYGEHQFYVSSSYMSPSGWSQCHHSALLVDAEAYQWLLTGPVFRLRLCSIGVRI